MKPFFTFKRLFIALSFICLFSSLFAQPLSAQDTTPAPNAPAATQDEKNFTHHVKIPKKLPIFQIDGLSSEDLDQDVMLIHFFAVWCAQCAQEAPSLVKLTNEHKLPIYGINSVIKPDDNPGAYFLANGQPYTKWGKDDASLLWRALKLTSTPFSVLINKDHKILWTHKGVMTANIINADLLPYVEEARQKAKEMGE